jgi:hypothetical protein
MGERWSMARQGKQHKLPQSGQGHLDAAALPRPVSLRSPQVIARIPSAPTSIRVQSPLRHPSLSVACARALSYCRCHQGMVRFTTPTRRWRGMRAPMGAGPKQAVCSSRKAGELGGALHNPATHAGGLCSTKVRAHHGTRQVSFPNLPKLPCGLPSCLPRWRRSPSLRPHLPSPTSTPCRALSHCPTPTSRSPS